MASLKKDENGEGPIWDSTNITTKTDTVVSTTPTIFHGIVINKAGSTDTLVVYNNTAASGTIIGSITVQAGTEFYGPYDCVCSVGLTITSGGGTAGDYTVLYS